jgi:myo-inositol 2-dehydrogenase / D-chiro-inositol 1-dehydrogenase
MDVITDPEVEAVWICSPSQYHAEQIKACAANGKHVFCEKPIATDLGETVEAINACNAANVKLMIGLQRRFDQNFVRVRKAVKNKEVGDTIMIKLCSRDPAPPPFSYVKGGGGIFTDMA